MIYLDNASTTKPSDEVCKAVLAALSQFGNPSSLHRLGMNAEKIITTAKESTARALGVGAKNIYFTSGGTEANNMAILGYAMANKKRGNHVITTKIEHPSVLEPFKVLEKNGFSVTYLDADKNGEISLSQLEDALLPDTILVSVMAVNNETGTIQPIYKIKEIMKNKSPKAVLHSDAVQGFLKVELKPKKWGIDLLSISGHKIYATKGTGAIYIGDNINISPILVGGGQQKNMRSGTENVPGIAAFGAAVESYLPIKTGTRELFLEKLSEKIDNIKINGTENNSGYVLNVSFLGIKAEILLHSLEAKGIYVSTGSACSSNKPMPSHVLSAMGCTAEEIKGAVRFSFSNEEFDADAVTDIIRDEVLNIRKYVR